MGVLRPVFRRLSRLPGQTTLRWPGRLVEVMSLVQLLVFLGLLVVLANLRALAPQVDRILSAFGPVAMLGAGLATAAVLGQVWVWRRGAGRLGVRVFDTGVALLGVLFSLSLLYWRVLPPLW